MLYKFFLQKNCVAIKDKKHIKEEFLDVTRRETGGCMKFFGAVLTFAVIITVTAVEFPAGIHVSNFGEMRLGECEFQFKFAEESWRSWNLNAHWQSMKRE